MKASELKTIEVDGRKIPKKHASFYRNFRDEVMLLIESKGKGKIGEFILVGPDLFHLMCRLVTDPRVRIKDKAKLFGAIAYFTSPVDLIPAAVFGPIGFADDIALSAYVINSLLSNTSQEVLREHWAGQGDVLETIQNIIASADDIIGGGFMKRLMKLADGEEVEEHIV